MHIRNTSPARLRQKPRTPPWRSALRGLLVAAALAAGGGGMAQTADFHLPSGSWYPTQAIVSLIDVNNFNGATNYASGELQYEITALPGNLDGGDFSCNHKYGVSLCDTITVTGNTLTMPLQEIGNALGDIGRFEIVLSLPANVAVGSHTMVHSIKVVATGTVISSGTQNITIFASGSTDPTITFPSAAVTVNQGGMVSGALKVNNSGGSNIAAGTLEYIISGLSAVGAHTPICTSCQSIVIDNGALKAKLPAIAGGATPEFTVSYSISSTATTGLYTESHNVVGLATALPAHSRNVTVQASGSPPPPPLAGDTSLTPVTVPTGAGNVVLKIEINNSGGTGLSNVNYRVTGLPTGADVSCSAATGVTCGGRTGAGGSTQVIALGAVASNAVATFTITYPVTATTPAHTGQHSILHGAAPQAVFGRTGAMPFAWGARSGAGGATSVPAIAPLGLLLMSLLAAGVPAAVARRRRK